MIVIVSYLIILKKTNEKKNCETLHFFLQYMRNLFSNVIGKTYYLYQRQLKSV